MKIRWLTIFAVLLLSQSAPAASRAEAAAIVQQIQQEIASPDAKTFEKLTGEYDKLLEADAPKAAAMLRDRWIKELMDKRHYAQVEQLCLKTILAEPSDMSLVEAMQQGRIRANLAAGNPRRALEEAKGLYNVSSLSTTSSAMLTFAECLGAAYPDKPEIVQQFESQQIDGAKSEMQPATMAQPVLAGIHVDDADYRDTLAHALSEDYSSLMGRGNLLLLADHPAQARSVFERAYSQATDAQLAAASEALARQMKAQDGTIARANAWVESIRPKNGEKP